MSQRANSAGISLIEMLVALAASVIVLAGMIEIFVVAEKNSQFQQGLLAVQDELATIAKLRATLRMAGFAGCKSFAPENIFIETARDPDAIPASETLTITHAGGQAVQLATRMHRKNMIQAEGDFSLWPGKQLVISDCLSAEVAVVSHVIQAGQIKKIFLLSPLHRLYPASAEMFSLQRDTFFVGKSRWRDVTGKSGYALFRRDLSGKKVELLSGVTGMHLVFSIQQHNSLLEVGSNALTDPEQIRAITIEMETLPFSPQWKKNKVIVTAALRNIGAVK